MSVRSKQSLRTQEFLAHQDWQGSPGYFEMPPTPHPTLLDSLMAHLMLFLRLSSWAVTSTLLALGFLLIFFLLSLLDNTADRFRSTASWSTLLIPLLILYLTIIPTRLRRLLDKTIACLRPVTANPHCDFLVGRTYAHKRSREWLAALSGGLIYTASHITPTSLSSVATAWYQVGGGMLVGGLIGWHLFVLLTITQRLATLDNETRHNEGNTETFSRPLFWWCLGVCLHLLTILLLNLSLSPDNTSQQVIFNGLLLASIIFIIVNSKVITALLWPQMQGYMKTPHRKTPSLVDEAMRWWMRRTRLSSWPVASVALGLLSYAFNLLTVWTEDIIFTEQFSWRLSLLTPSMLIYLLCGKLLLAHILDDTVAKFHEFAPQRSRQFNQLAQDVYTLHRGQEWAVIGLGCTINLLLSPYWHLNIFSYSVLFFDLFVGNFVFGLLAWLIYNGLIRTRKLADLHTQLDRLAVFNHHAPVEPIIRWSMSNALIFIGGILLSALFLGERVFYPITIITYSALISATVLIFVFSKVPPSLLSWFRIFRIVAIFVLVAAIGTIGFYQLESHAQDLTYMDALYMTVITMTTIGYGDMTPITPSGRFFTIMLSLVAVGIGGYAVSGFASFIVEGDLNKILQGSKMDKQIANLHNHIILCGAGQVGRQIATELYRTKTPFIMVEQSSAVVNELLHTADILYVTGDATKDKVLLSAGIERASGLITALSDDKENAFVVLTARALNPNPRFRVIARLTDEENTEKLKRAGASELVSPSTIGGLRMASVMLRPSVVSFLDGMLRAEELSGQTLRVEEIGVSELNAPGLLGKPALSIIDVGRHTKLLVLAVKATNGEYIHKPRGDTLLNPDDLLIVIGTPEELAFARGR